MYVIRRSPEAATVLGRYHQLYRFSRNLSCALFLAFTYSVMWYYFSSVQEPSAAMRQSNVVLLAYFPFLLIGALLFLLHFYYLYVCYYSKFLFRAFIFLSNPEPSPAVHGKADAD